MIYAYYRAMVDRYLPSSEFLNYILAGEVAFDLTTLGQANLKCLLTLVTDEDRANRDWAAFLIAGLSLDTEEIRLALITAADDADHDTRDEAIVGLARRDRAAALERLRPLLEEEIGLVLLEAATILGDRSLISALKEIESWEGDDDAVREQLRLALAACEAGVGHDVAGHDLVYQHRLSE
ncbi:lyase [Sphingomonas sp. So64.6b]|uniref:lyase n=1 Tax=Sphingomonas sp. So64.6b TaxID=2997354 RepID=UPI0016029630|nr:lyase [Sphingomonas sp. So64.6b]QNA86501.1 lyase [Sphingomonas sp. So64.6b]